MFFADQHENKLKKLDEVCKDVTQILQQNQNTNKIKFVIALWSNLYISSAFMSLYQ
jgi:hypothetical protein